MGNQKLQAAMEYMMTYSWAILIISIVVVMLFTIGVFNLNNWVNNQCVLPAQFSCPNLGLASNGLLTINLYQATTTPINITAIGCNTNNTVAHMYLPYNPNAPNNQIKMNIGANYTFGVFCWAGNTQIAPAVGAAFRGFVIINYTEASTGFPHSIPGQLTVKVVQ